MQIRAYHVVCICAQLVLSRAPVLASVIMTDRRQWALLMRALQKAASLPSFPCPSFYPSLSTIGLNDAELY